MRRKAAEVSNTIAMSQHSKMQHQPDRKRTKRAEMQELRPCNGGLPTFGSYNQVIGDAGLLAGAQGVEWEWDEEEEMHLLKGQDGKWKGVIMAAWEGEEDEDKEGEETRFMIHPVWKTEFEKEIKKKRKIRVRHKGVDTNGEWWIEGKLNPTLTMRAMNDWALDRGWDPETKEVDAGKPTARFETVLFKGKASMKLVQYLGGRLGVQGKAPARYGLTTGDVGRLFLEEWGKKKEKVEENGVKVFQKMKRSLSGVKQEEEEEEGGEGGRRGSARKRRTPSKLMEKGMVEEGKKINLTKNLARLVWKEVGEKVRAETAMEAKMAEMANKGAMQEVLSKWYEAAIKLQLDFLVKWKEGQLEEWDGELSGQGRQAVEALGWGEEQVGELKMKYVGKVVQALNEIREMQKEWGKEGENTKKKLVWEGEKGKKDEGPKVKGAIKEKAQKEEQEGFGEEDRENSKKRKKKRERGRNWGKRRGKRVDGEREGNSKGAEGR